MTLAVKFLGCIGRTIEGMPGKRYLLLVLLLVFSSRITAVLVIGELDKPLLYESGMIARNFLAGHGYSVNYRYPMPESRIDPREYKNGSPMPTAFTLPGYVAVVAATLALLGDSQRAYLTLYGLNIAASIATVLLLYSTALNLLGKRRARFGTLLFALHPPAIAYVATFGGGPWYHLILMTALYFLVRAARSKSMGSVLLAGTVAGVWVLFRSEALVLGWIGTLWLGKRVGARKALMYAVTAVVVVFPWSIRNSVVFDSFVPLTTNAWLNIWRGCNAEASGGSFDSRGEANWFDSAGEIPKAISSLPVTPRYELDVMEIYRRHTVAFVSSNPGSAVVLYGKKLLLFLTMDISDPRIRNIAFALPHVALSAAAFFGIVLASRRRRASLLIVVPIVFYVFLIPVFHVETRYQVMVSILYCLAAVLPMHERQPGSVRAL
ncbi:MAG: glycosyltransferase family 39 protein [Ignavibacteriae bacterium]|nr:glycosyltransferase family 39 protein [Ignavibacteriota bacterium]